MKTFVKTFRGKMSYTKIDKYIDLVRRTLDPDDYFDLEIQYDEGWQFIKFKFCCHRPKIRSISEC